MTTDDGELGRYLAGLRSRAVQFSLDREQRIDAAMVQLRKAIRGEEPDA